MNKLNTQRQVQVIAYLVEGNSIRSTCRMTGVAKNTVVKLLVDIGAACSEYQDITLRNLTCQRLQCDEIWAFCYSKDKNVPEEHRGEFGYGDVWTWIAIDADTKLVTSWLVGNRDGACAMAFLTDLADRLTSYCHPQLTTDGYGSYLNAVYEAFGGEVDYAMLIKLFGPEPGGEKRYSPAHCLGTEKRCIVGNPDKEHIATSFFERQNLTLRMGMRRFTRLTNAFSKKVENHAAAISLHYMYYNFARPHQTLTKRETYPTTPAMAAGVSDHVWTLAEIVALLNS